MIGHDQNTVYSYSVWKGVLTHDARRAHEKWLDAGRLGTGRLEIEAKDLSGAAVHGIYSFAKVTNCNLSDVIFKRSFFDHAEFRQCTISRGIFDSAEFQAARFERCALDEARLMLTNARGASAVDCVFRNCGFARSEWRQAALTDCDLTGAGMRDVDLIDAILTDCIFRDVDFRANLSDRPEWSAKGARFIRCDFRGARLDGWRLDGTLFDRCSFHGATGTPQLDGPVTLIAPDVSEAADGTKLATEKYVGRDWPL